MAVMIVRETSNMVAVVSNEYDSATGRLVTSRGIDGSDVSGSYTYDDAGCVTRIERVGKPTLDLTWNGQYQLVSVATNGAFAEGYAYDALGRRVATTTFEGTIRHVYDNNWQCIADVDTNGNVLRSYVWGDGIDNLLAVRIDDETYTTTRDVDSHSGGAWKRYDRQGNRATLDRDLNPIGR